MPLRSFVPEEIPLRQPAPVIAPAASIGKCIAVPALAASDASRCRRVPLPVVTDADLAPPFLRMTPVPLLAAPAAETRPLVIAVPHIDEFPALRTAELPDGNARHGLAVLFQLTTAGQNLLYKLHKEQRDTRRFYITLAINIAVLILTIIGLLFD